MKEVTTPFVFIHQHDFVLEKNFDLNGLIATMMANPKIKHVRPALGQANQNLCPSWNGPVDEEIEGPHFVPLCRTFGWSDNDHVARRDYYDTFVLPRCGHGPMEDFLHWQMQEAFNNNGKQGHEPFGTYFFGHLTDGAYFSHSDGRRSR
jgi:hypothetical protein